MSRFNLVDEAWIKVIKDKKGQEIEVSLRELFLNAHTYYGLAGDTKTQDFAVFRVLLAILHTVFSRLDVHGQAYKMLNLDEKYYPEGEVEEDDFEEYQDLLYETWLQLSELEAFPDIVQKYLDAWKSRFFLFDLEFPFFQVKAEDISKDKINKTSVSEISGKNINRTISESSNKIALFSPKYEFSNNKEILSDAEIARWLITFQSYTGLSDKTKFNKNDYKVSKGWLFDIGGVFLQGETLFETLLLNLVLVHPDSKYRNQMQKPSWEFCSNKILDTYFPQKLPDNLAELYTVWSRAIYIDPDFDTSKPFTANIVKLPEVIHQNLFLEPMTVWRYNEQGDNKNTFTPKKHPSNESVWRSFGLIAMPTSEEMKQIQPGVIDWFSSIQDQIKRKHQHVAIISVSMEDDRNATSWVPVNEIVDSLLINYEVLADVQENHWVPRITATVEDTKSIISKNFRRFLADIATIRNMDDKLKEGFISRKILDIYYNIDAPFRDWLISIKAKENKDEKVSEWNEILKRIILLAVDQILEEASSRDYIGVEEGGKVKNIATAYNTFIYFLNKSI